MTRTAATFHSAVSITVQRERYASFYSTEVVATDAEGGQHTLSIFTALPLEIESLPERDVRALEAAGAAITTQRVAA